MFLIFLSIKFVVFSKTGQITVQKNILNKILCLFFEYQID